MERETHNRRRGEWETNRSMKRRPHRTKPGWCSGCDSCMVHGGEKCPVCGHQADRVRRNKHENNEGVRE